MASLPARTASSTGSSLILRSTSPRCTPASAGSSWDDGRTTCIVSTGGGVGPELPTYVYSRSLPEGERDGVTFARDAVSHVRRLKEGDGKPLWLWGGGDLFRELAQAGLVDGVDVAVIPIVLGAGLPLMAAPGARLSLKLKSHRVYAATGTLMLTYDVRPEPES